MSEQILDNVEQIIDTSVEEEFTQAEAALNTAVANLKEVNVSVVGLSYIAGTVINADDMTSLVDTTNDVVDGMNKVIDVTEKAIVVNNLVTAEAKKATSEAVTAKTEANEAAKSANDAADSADETIVKVDNIIVKYESVKDTVDAIGDLDSWRQNTVNVVDDQVINGTKTFSDLAYKDNNGNVTRVKDKVNTITTNIDELNQKVSDTAVTLTGTQTISGEKTFSNIKIQDSYKLYDLKDKINTMTSEINTLNHRVNDTAVTLTGAQTISGEKTFEKVILKSEGLRSLFFLPDGYYFVDNYDDTFYRDGKFYCCAYTTVGSGSSVRTQIALIVYDDINNVVDSIKPLVAKRLDNQMAVSVTVDSDSTVWLSVIEMDSLSYTQEAYGYIYKVKDGVIEYIETPELGYITVGKKPLLTEEDFAQEGLFSSVEDTNLFLYNTLSISTIDRVTNAMTTIWQKPSGMQGDITQLIVDSLYYWVVINEYYGAKLLRVMRDNLSHIEIKMGSSTSWNKIHKIHENVKDVTLHIVAGNNGIYELDKLSAATGAYRLNFTYDTGMQMYDNLSSCVYNNQLYLLTCGSGYDRVKANVVWCNLGQNRLELKAECVLTSENSYATYRLYANDDAFVIKNSNGLQQAKQAMDLREELDDLNDKITKINLSGDGDVQSNDRYLELKGDIAAISLSTLQVGDGISNLANDKNYQTKSQVTTLVEEKISTLAPGTGGGGTTIWTGRVREDSIWSEVVLSNDKKCDNWCLELDYIPDVRKYDVIRLYMETDPYSTTYENNLKDKLYVDMVVQDSMSQMASDFFSDIIEDYPIRYIDTVQGNIGVGFNVSSFGTTNGGFQTFSNRDCYSFAAFNGATLTENYVKVLTQMSGVQGSNLENELAEIKALFGDGERVMSINNSRSSSSMADYWNYSVSDTVKISSAVAECSLDLTSSYSSNVYIHGGNRDFGVGEERLFYITKIEVIKR